MYAAGLLISKIVHLCTSGLDLDCRRLQVGGVNNRQTRACGRTVHAAEPTVLTLPRFYGVRRPCFGDDALVLTMMFLTSVKRK